MNTRPRPTPVEHHDAVVRRLREIVDNAQQPEPETPPPPPPKPKRGALLGTAAIVVGIVALAAVAAVVYSVTRPKPTPTAQTQPATAPPQQNAKGAQPSDEEMAAAKRRLGDALLKMAKPTDTAPSSPASPAPAAEPAPQAAAPPPQAAAPPQTAAPPPPPKVEARPEPAAPQPAQPTVSADDASKMLARASSLIREGQIASARSLLQLALRSNDPSVAFALAETYDPKTLARWRAIGIAGDVERARALYKQAADGGVAEASARLSDLDR